MSNFPIDLFRKPYEVPVTPTFGIKLCANQRERRSIESPAQLAAAIFASARNCLGYDFIARNRDYRNLIAYIDTGDHNWLDLDMRDEDKLDLFVRGAESAADFLKGFDWEGYKELRERTAKTFTHTS